MNVYIRCIGLTVKSNKQYHYVFIGGKPMVYRLCLRKRDGRMVWRNDSKVPGWRDNGHNSVQVAVNRALMASETMGIPYFGPDSAFLRSYQSYDHLLFRHNCLFRTSQIATLAKYYDDEESRTFLASLVLRSSAECNSCGLTA